MGGPNLEVFKFGMYIMFPIGWMYYFGTNLDNKFSVKDFWPTKEQMHKIPHEREEIDAELERLKRRRLTLRSKRLEEEANGSALSRSEEEIEDAIGGARLIRGGPLDTLGERAGEERNMSATIADQSRKTWADWARGK